MPNTYKPSSATVKRDTAALPKWERKLVTQQTEKVARRFQNPRDEWIFLQAIWNFNASERAEGETLH